MDGLSAFCRPGGEASVTVRWPDGSSKVILISASALGSAAAKEARMDAALNAGMNGLLGRSLDIDCLMEMREQREAFSSRDH